MKVICVENILVKDLTKDKEYTVLDVVDVGFGKDYLVKNDLGNEENYPAEIFKECVDRT